MDVCWLTQPPLLLPSVRSPAGQRAELAQVQEEQDQGPQAAACEEGDPQAVEYQRAREQSEQETRQEDGQVSPNQHSARSLTVVTANERDRQAGQAVPEEGVNRRESTGRRRANELRRSRCLRVCFLIRNCVISIANAAGACHGSSRLPLQPLFWRCTAGVRRSVCERDRMIQSTGTAAISAAAAASTSARARQQIAAVPLRRRRCRSASKRTCAQP